jgi:TPR repeat protein
MHRALLLSGLLLTACSAPNSFTSSKKDTTMPPLSQLKANLAFTCVHERIPEAGADADTLFHYARWLEKNNQLKQDKAVDAQIERLYRIASEHNQYKANINLQNGSMRGHYHLNPDERLRLARQLIDAKVATGYFLVGYYLQRGAAGLDQDEEKSLRYFRKAADEGNAEAQYLVADRLAPSDMAPDIARQMRSCAAEQGHGKAARALGVNLQGKKKYQEASEAFQLGIAAGDEIAAGFLESGFRNPSPANELHYLGQLEDLERADRYEKIWSVLADYSYANPKVPEINEIVPLPPAKLPPWDGKLQWLKDREANIPPPKPSEALIEQMARARQLNPATGRPLPESPHFTQHEPSLFCHSQQPCPQEGYWKITTAGIWAPKVRYFKQGQTMPLCLVERYQPRVWPLPDKLVQQEETVQWGLVGEA